MAINVAADRNHMDSRKNIKYSRNIPWIGSAQRGGQKRLIVGRHGDLKRRVKATPHRRNSLFQVNKGPPNAVIRRMRCIRGFPDLHSPCVAEEEVACYLRPPSRYGGGCDIFPFRSIRRPSRMRNHCDMYRAKGNNWRSSRI